MQLAQDIQKIRWSVEYPKLNAILKEDSGTYRTLTIFFGILSLILAYFYPIALIITLTLCFYLWRAHINDKDKNPWAILFRIKQKECWQRSSSPNPSFGNYFYNLYFFEIENPLEYLITETRHERTSLKKIPNHISVNERIFQEFKEGEEAFFIFSPANDLVGYFYKGEIITLFKERVLSNGELFRVSVSIPLELTYPPTNGYVKISVE